MSYYKRSPETLQMIQQGTLENTDGCFICGDVMFCFVYWQGNTGIALHSSCADYLGWCLVKDAACLRLSMKDF